MRPPEFTGGNLPRSLLLHVQGSFNEAAGIHRRKHGALAFSRQLPGVASMRPPEFTGGNYVGPQGYPGGFRASMRPPEFTGGN